MLYIDLQFVSLLLLMACSTVSIKRNKSIIWWTVLKYEVNMRIPELTKKIECISSSGISATRKRYMHCNARAKIHLIVFANSSTSNQWPLALNSIKTKLFRTVWKIFIVETSKIIYAKLQKNLGNENLLSFNYNQWCFCVDGQINEWSFWSAQLM